MTVVAVNGVAATNGILDLQNKLDGSGDVTIDYSCDGTMTKGHGCPLGGEISGLLLETSLGAKWEPANQLRFGTVQCVDQDGAASTPSR